MAIQDDWIDWDEVETFVCAGCGNPFPRPALIIFAGQGETVETATEYCAACFGMVTGQAVIAPHMERLTADEGHSVDVQP